MKYIKSIIRIKRFVELKRLFCLLLFIFPTNWALNQVKPERINESLKVTKGQQNKRLKQIQALTSNAYVEIQHGGYESALDHLIEAKALNPFNKAEYAVYNVEFSHLFSSIGAYGVALEYQKKVLQNQTQDIGKYYANSIIGELWLKLNSPDSAFYYYDKQYEVALRMHDFIAVSSALNNKGLALMNQNKFKEALVNLIEAREYFEANKEKNAPYFESEKGYFVFSIIENIGRCQYYLKDYPNAVRELEYTSQFHLQNSINVNKVTLLLSYLSMNNELGAKKLISRLKKSSPSKSLEENSLLLDMELDYAIYVNNWQAATEVRKLKRLLQNDIELQKERNENRMSEMVSRYLFNEATVNLKRESEYKKVILKKLVVEQQKNTFYNSIIFTCVLLLLTGLLLFIQFYKNRRKKYELQNQELVFQNLQNEWKIKTQKNHLTEYAVDYKRNREFEWRLIKKLDLICEDNENQVVANINSLIAELKQKNIVEDRIEELDSKSIIILSEFKDLLLLKHPNLSKLEIDLCYLLFLDLSNKEIAIQRNVTTESIKQFKNRLKIKLGQESIQQMIHYLKSL